MVIIETLIFSDGLYGIWGTVLNVGVTLETPELKVVIVDRLFPYNVYPSRKNPMDMWIFKSQDWSSVPGPDPLTGSVMLYVKTFFITIFSQ